MLHKFIENPLVPRVKQFLSLNVAKKTQKTKNNDNMDMKKDQQRAV